MFFHIPDPGVLSHIEAVNSVMLRVLISAVVNTAAGNDHHVRALADKEVIVYRFFQAALGHYHGNMHALVFGAGFDPDLQAADLFLGNNFDIGR